MSDKYLIINAGSSSLKFSLYSMPGELELVNGLIEKIGQVDSAYRLKFDNQRDGNLEKINSHNEAVKVMLRELLARGFVMSVDEIKGVGHRVLHGGEYYADSVVIDEEVLNHIRELTKFGPLHHPGQIAGIEAMQQILPDVPQIAVFDTSFGQTMPKENYLYPVPYKWYTEYAVRKYGFHGTSHKYITHEMQRILGRDNINIISCHIGSGASISAIKDGVCIDTSMGLTPNAGLVMGTRCGDIDVSIIDNICKEEQCSVEDVMNALNTRSGLIGISGKSDYRDVEKLAIEGDENAQIALKMLRNSVLKYISQYYLQLGGKVDAIVFTAGIGENATLFRKGVMAGLEPLGIKLDEEANSHIAGFREYQSGDISTPDSRIRVVVLPTDEERMILKDTYRLCMEKGFQKKIGEKNESNGTK